MDYFIRGRFEIEFDEQLAAFLSVEPEIRDVVFKKGTMYRADYQGFRFDVFTIEGRTYTQPEGLKAFNAIKKLIADNEMRGWVGWHECTHEEDGQPCEWDDYFSWGVT